MEEQTTTTQRIQQRGRQVPERLTARFAQVDAALARRIMRDYAPSPINMQHITRDPWTTSQAPGPADVDAAASRDVSDQITQEGARVVADEPRVTSNELDADRLNERMDRVLSAMKLFQYPYGGYSTWRRPYGKKPDLEEAKEEVLM